MQNDLPKLEAEIDFMRVNDLSANDVFAEAQILYARWPKMEIPEKRRIVESILEKVTIRVHPFEKRPIRFSTVINLKEEARSVRFSVSDRISKYPSGRIDRFSKSKPSSCELIENFSIAEEVPAIESTRLQPA